MPLRRENTLYKSGDFRRFIDHLFFLRRKKKEKKDENFRKKKERKVRVKKKEYTLVMATTDWRTASTTTGRVSSFTEEVFFSFLLLLLSASAAAVAAMAAAGAATKGVVCFRAPFCPLALLRLFLLLFLFRRVQPPPLCVFSRRFRFFLFFKCRSPRFSLLCYRKCPTLCSSSYYSSLSLSF